MFKGAHTIWLRWSTAGIIALALSLLAFAHDMPARPIPVVLAPDGTVAVLCLADWDEGAPPHSADSCEACRIVHAATCPDMAGITSQITWRHVDQDAPRTSIGVRFARTFDAAPRAPPA